MKVNLSINQFQKPITGFGKQIRGVEKTDLLQFPPSTSFTAKTTSGMATKRHVLKSIDQKVRGIYSAWQIGVTQDLIKDRTYWDRRSDVFNWSDWEMDSYKDAIDVEKYFTHEMHMKSSGRITGLDPNKRTYVFVF